MLRCVITRSVVLALAVLAHGALAQISISGLSDKGVYSGSVSFTIEGLAGFAYDVWLNTNRVASATTVKVAAPDYYELGVWRTNLATGETTNRLVRFIVRAADRGSAETGLPAWTPWPDVESSSEELAGAGLRLLMPGRFPAGYPLPLVAWVENARGHAVRVNGRLTAPGQKPVPIRRGVGSGLLSASNSAGQVNFEARLGILDAYKVLNLAEGGTWVGVSGALSGSNTWPAGAWMAVTSSLVIHQGASLTIGQGTVVRLGPGVDIAVFGEVDINGTTANPVVFMPEDRLHPWGGFLLQGSARLSATGALFTGSGAVTNWFGSGGRPGSHRTEQALFYLTNSPSLELTDCAAFDLAGQFGHAVKGGTLTLTRFLMQRTCTGGDYTGAAFKVNDGAFIECPDDSRNYVDGDNDALYIVNGTHGFTNTLFGWTKDDGVDSGGSSAGRLDFENCWFESSFHEGNALSGTGKVVNHHGSVFLNCGQGLESGYDGPVGTMDSCLALGNLVGARFGDNYDWSYSGFLRVTNSLLLNNYRDVWGMNWQDWTYRTNLMDVQSNLVSRPLAFHPANALWDAQRDGPRLARFLTASPGARVGVGFAEPFSKPPSALTNALAVRLSAFSVDTVEVRYVVETPEAVLAGGNLQFEPGETLKLIPALSAVPVGVGLVCARLLQPRHGEITGSGVVYFQDNAVLSREPRVARFGSEWFILWNDAQATLQQSAAPDGPWADVPSSSPVSLDFTGRARFFRTRR